MLNVQCTEEVGPFQDEETRKEYEEHLDFLALAIEISYNILSVEDTLAPINFEDDQEDQIEDDDKD